MKPPAFQFYSDDFLAGTFDMSQSDVGAYIRLLCVQWNRGSIPVQPEKLTRLAGGDVSDEVLCKFTPDGNGGLTNKRLEHERVKQMQFRELQREKGLASAEARKQQRLNRGSTAVKKRMEPNGNSPSPSPVLNTLATPPNQGSLDLPEQPRKRARNKVFDCICEVCSSNPDEAISIAKSGSLIGRVEQMVRSIHKTDDDRICDEIRKRAKAYRAKFKDCALTPTALEKHWPSLGVAIAQLSQDEILGLKTQIRSLRGYNTSDPKERAGYESQAVALIAKLAACGEVYP